MDKEKDDAYSMTYFPLSIKFVKILCTPLGKQKNYIHNTPGTTKAEDCRDITPPEDGLLKGKLYYMPFFFLYVFIV